jgi:hypothetical protein
VELVGDLGEAVAANLPHEQGLPLPVGQLVKAADHVGRGRTLGCQRGRRRLAAFAKDPVAVGDVTADRRQPRLRGSDRYAFLEGAGRCQPCCLRDVFRVLRADEATCLSVHERSMLAVQTFEHQRR